jgi:CubicO group peptidase (beta-lactamase class C family)
MVREPGERQVYCSAGANLAGGVLQHAAKRALPEMMEELLGAPLQMKRYYLPSMPNGDAYMGGGAKFLPRDFIKLAQLHVNKGTWNGRRILSQDWCERATSPYQASTPSKWKYGYLWWTFDYPFQGKTVRAFYANGNGGQFAIGIPELDLVIGFYGGNYSASLPVETDYVPNWILPAIDKP